MKRWHEVQILIVGNDTLNNSFGGNYHTDVTIDFDMITAVTIKAAKSR